MSTARNIKIRIGARLPVLPKKVEHFNSSLPEEKKLCEFVRHDCNSCPDTNPRLRSVAHVLVALFTLIALGARTYGQTPAPEVRVRVHPHPQVHVNDFEDSEMTVSEQETINKSFPFPATGGRRSVDVDNVWGFVHVTGGSSDQVQLVAKKTIRAESKDKLELAKKDVTLDIGQQGNALTFYVNGPFRCHCDCCANCREHQGYIVKYEFELQVPRDIDLTARTVNDGDVIVQNVAGQYSVHNVNGPVEMRDVAGSGDAKTVNGELKVLFRGNPQSNSSFASLNGDVDLYFLPKLSADLRFKTFNGAVFSDFEMAALPQRQPVEEHQNGKFIFRADRYAGGRVAGGGPEIKVETLNGDIHIRERHD
jgi:hypothetical protein